MGWIRPGATVCAVAALIGPVGSALATPPPLMGSGATDRSPATAAMVGVLPAGATPGSVVVAGLAGQRETLSVAELAKLPQAHVAVDHDGLSTDYSGPLLSDVLRDVGAPLGVRLHGAGVDDVVFVTAADKYRVVLTLAEVDPSFHKDAKVILAVQADGKPLPSKQGPVRLVVYGDLKPSRSVYAVVAVALAHLP